MEAVRDRIIVALDTTDGTEAIRIAESLQGRARRLKVGSTLFLAEGPAIVGRLRALGFDVFVDLKLHDIPHQVDGAVRELTRLGAWMLTVHASGGGAMVAAAASAAAETAHEHGIPRPLLVAVTVLTSLDADALAQVGVPAAPADEVSLLARLAASSGADGVVCSPQESAMVRALLGPEAAVVTPGVRPVWAAKGDQARVTTPAEAFAAGSSHIVVGRPITASPDPAVAFERVAQESEEAS